MEVNQPKLSKNQYDSLSYTEKHKTRSQAKAKERIQATNSPIKAVQLLFLNLIKIIECTFKLLTQISHALLKRPISNMSHIFMYHI